ncbi:VCBS repeat-containing protein [candidate division KSB1 bacterium]|nr:VCBS repeat-containing protein [candidate division KSB1 bacterium]
MRPIFQNFMLFLAVSVLLNCSQKTDLVPLNWIHLSSQHAALQKPSTSTQQTASLILDIDKDGLNDFVICGRKAQPSVCWYQRIATGWKKYVIDAEILPIEAGGTFTDVDGDGDQDIIMGGDTSTNELWWWENPYPEFDPAVTWIRRQIKNSGDRQSHDQLCGDFDGDGRDELVFWNQRGKKLYFSEIPENPGTDAPWDIEVMWSWNVDFKYEGLAKGDIDGDGIDDVVGGGRWFKRSDENWEVHVVDADYGSSRSAVADLVRGDRPEIVLASGDMVGPLNVYQWDGSKWLKTTLVDSVDHGHSLDVVDMNGDGYCDIFCAEMRLSGRNPDSRMYIFLGDGNGNFVQTEVAQGYGNHESRVADLDGDGDVDILGKPYNWNSPRVDIWLNEPLAKDLELTQWERLVIDTKKPYKSVFIYPGDLDNDGLIDIASGSWWYKNPGTTSGTWERKMIGEPLYNLGLIYDFDGDGDLDVFGTQEREKDNTALFAWAQNNGDGTFKLYENIEPGKGDFLQGTDVVTLIRKQDELKNSPPWYSDLKIVLSWHKGGMGVQAVTVPAEPTLETWAWGVISEVSQDEQLTVADIDGDRLQDIHLGTRWLKCEDRNGDQWSLHTINEIEQLPDRNRIADMDKDGRLDVVIGFETADIHGKLAWYEQGEVPTDLWTEHVIDSLPGRAMSLDVADMDLDGDMDIVVGEHFSDLKKPEEADLFVYENLNGDALSWQKHLIYTGDEHHDGTQICDIDADGDLDIISIGWKHPRVVLYENKSID